MKKMVGKEPSIFKGEIKMKKLFSIASIIIAANIVCKYVSKQTIRNLYVDMKIAEELEDVIKEDK